MEHRGLKESPHAEPQRRRATQRKREGSEGRPALPGRRPASLPFLFFSVLCAFSAFGEARRSSAPLRLCVRLLLHLLMGGKSRLPTRARSRVPRRSACRGVIVKASTT